MATCLIGLGANQGDRAANLAAAVELLSKIPEVRVVRNSGEYESQAAVGGALQTDFINSALTLHTELAPRQVLAALQRIEDQLGRRREDRWGAREIDLDLLLYDDLVLADVDLTLPHPRMAFRRFVLAPLAEIAPDFVHPTTGCSVSELLTRLDVLPRRICITGASTQQNRRLARRIAAKTLAALVEDPPGGGLADGWATLLASPSCQTAVELMVSQRDHLRRVRSELEKSNAENALEIAGFWTGEGHALAKLMLSADEFREFERRREVEQEATNVDPTTLLVVLLVEGQDAWERPLQEEIKRLATRPRQSPWLLLDGRDPDWAVTEVVAAIEAMQ